MWKILLNPNCSTRFNFSTDRQCTMPRNVHFSTIKYKKLVSLRSFLNVDILLISTTSDTLVDMLFPFVTITSVCWTILSGIFISTLSCFIGHLQRYDTEILYLFSAVNKTRWCFSCCEICKVLIIWYSIPVRFSCFDCISATPLATYVTNV